MREHQLSPEIIMCVSLFIDTNHKTLVYIGLISCRTHARTCIAATLAWRSLACAVWSENTDKNLDFHVSAFVNWTADILDESIGVYAGTKRYPRVHFLRRNGFIYITYDRGRPLYSARLSLEVACRIYLQTWLIVPWNFIITTYSGTKSAETDFKHLWHRCTRWRV